ncbi:MAG: quinone-dependent dihydroorotate dehydrogenase [Sphingomicrobium sp.]
MALYSFLRPLLFTLDAERAHRMTIAALKLMPKRVPALLDPILTTSVAGLTFPSPLGLAAGFDKNAEVLDPMLALGFGFVEVGTLTPLLQTGNSKPRLFRLAEDEAVINRMGFNNDGQQAALARLRRRRRRRRRRGIVGVNVGANKVSTDRIADYATGVATMSSVADYITINISSPNTPGLRKLQAGGELVELLAAVRGVRRPSIPVFLKVAPDLRSGEHARIVRAAIDSGINALIVANTTISRPPLRSRQKDQQGGLSGAPLKPLALQSLRQFRAAAGGTLPLIAAGGIASADDAFARIRAGASLVQLYTALVYEGPGLARRITAGLADRLRRDGFASIAEAVGSE